MSEKRFSYEYSENSAMIRIIDREKEEPNGWNMCNVAYTVKRLNEQQATINELKERNAHNFAKKIELMKENEHLRKAYEICKHMLSEAIGENELLECKEGVYNVHNLKRDYEQLKKENEQLKEQVQILKKEVRDFLHLCDVYDIQSHLSDECEEVLNDE